MLPSLSQALTDMLDVIVRRRMADRLSFIFVWTCPVSERVEVRNGKRKMGRKMLAFLPKIWHFFWDVVRFGRKMFHHMQVRRCRYIRRFMEREG